MRDGYENLVKVVEYCEKKYLEINNWFKLGGDRVKVFEELRVVFNEMK